MTPPSLLDKTRHRAALLRRGVTGRGLAAVKRFEPEHALLLCADPRGGSTWLSEIVTLIPRTALLWEPLSLQNAPRVRDLGFAWRQYIPDDAEWPEAEAFMREVLSGQWLNGWTYGKTPPAAWLRADRLAVKFCRASALLPWLTQTLAFRCPPVHLVRHPFAVVASQLAHGGWNKPHHGFGEPGSRHNEIWAAHEGYLATLSTKAEALTALWAISNGAALNHPRAGTDWLTVHYEHLVSDPEGEIDRIFAAWKEPVPEAAAEQAHTASSTTRTATFEMGVEAQLGKWRRQLPAKAIDRMAAVLEHLGVEQYDRSLLPLQ